jgi:uncharacterized delta-60 repeat protein
VNTAFGDGGEAVVLQEYGKIVVLGARGLLRYNADGTLDASFGHNGKVMVGGSSLALQPDGRILVGGWTATVSTFTMETVDLLLQRYDTNGNPDSTFGKGGSVVVNNGFVSDISTNPPATFSVVLQPDGKIVAAGFPLGDTSGTPLLVRLTPNGQLDASFGSGGQVPTDFASGSAASAHRLAVQRDGRIVVAGSAATNGGDFLLERYNADGSKDSSFGNGGQVATNFAGGADAATGLLEQPDGKLVAVGSAVNAAALKKFALARYLGDDAGRNQGGSPNAAFVTQVYLDLLQRSPDPGGLAHWTGLLEGGQASRQQVVQAIANSPEYHQNEIEFAYGLYLHRTAAPGGLSGWSAFLASGGTYDQMRALILGSAEYLADAGGTNDAFLTAVYRDLLGRGVDPVGSQGWGQVLGNGVDRGAVAAAILRTHEGTGVEIAGLYQGLLHRAPDPTGLASDIAALHQGVPSDLLLAAIAGSDEYFATRI